MKVSSHDESDQVDRISQFRFRIESTDAYEYVIQRDDRYGPKRA